MCHYRGFLETLDPYKVNMLDLGRQTGKTTFANSLDNAWVFTPYRYTQIRENTWGPTKLSKLVNDPKYSRGLLPPKYLVLDDYTEEMLVDVLKLHLILSSPLYTKENKHMYIVVLGNKF